MGESNLVLNVETQSTCVCRLPALMRKGLANSRLGTRLA